MIGTLSYFFEATGQIAPQQYVFTAGWSTAGAINAVMEFVRRARRLGIKCCIVALDIADALDNAWQSGILARFWDLKCPTFT